MITSKPKLILVCDDDKAFRERLAQAFCQKGIEACLAANAAQAVAVFSDRRPDSAIIDLKMPGDSGLTLLKRLKEIDSSCRIIVLTGYGSISTAMESVRLGAYSYLTKPTSFQNIFSALCNEASTQNFKVATPSLDEVEREYVQRVLDANEGNISQTAKVLGLHRRSLQRKLSKSIN